MIVVLRPAARVVRDLGGLSMALRRAVLFVQNFSDGDDFIGFDPDDYGVHGGALYCDLSPAASPRHVNAVSRGADDRRCLVGGLRHYPAVPASHKNLLLPEQPHTTGTASQRFADVQHSDALAAAHALLLSGTCILRQTFATCPPPALHRKYPARGLAERCKLPQRIRAGKTCFGIQFGSF